MKLIIVVNINCSASISTP